MSTQLFSGLTTAQILGYSVIKVMAVNASGATIDSFGSGSGSGNYIPISGGTITGNLVMSGNIYPVTSGTETIGTSSNPFSGIYSNQYETTAQISNSTSFSGTSPQIINFNSGSYAFITITGNNTYAYLQMTGIIPGSTYVVQTLNNSYSGSTNVYWTGNNILWAGGILGGLTLTSGSNDLFCFISNGSNLFGSFTSNYK